MKKKRKKHNFIDNLYNIYINNYNRIKIINNNIFILNLNNFIFQKKKNNNNKIFI